MILRIDGDKQADGPDPRPSVSRRTPIAEAVDRHDFVRSGGSGNLALLRRRYDRDHPCPVGRRQLAGGRTDATGALALAALPGTALGRLGEPSTASSAAWSARVWYVARSVVSESEPVGAENSVTLCDLQVFVDEAAESVSS
jgi:hypothetical protein